MLSVSIESAKCSVTSPYILIKVADGLLTSQFDHLFNHFDKYLASPQVTTLQYLCCVFLIFFKSFFKMNNWKIRKRSIVTRAISNNENDITNLVNWFQELKKNYSEKPSNEVSSNLDIIFDMD